MTEHKATPELWAGIERFASETLYGACIMELRSRVEALEAAQRVIASPSSNRTHLGLTQDAPASSNSLVKRMAYAITGDSDGWKPEARAAILAVADWLDQQELHIAATRLRMEAQ